MNTLPKSILVKSQSHVSDWKNYKENGETYRIRACIRWDDSCNNKHNSFVIIGVLQRKANKHSIWKNDSFGCMHEEIQKHFPEYSHLIKWHLITSEGPLWYKENFLYHLKAGEGKAKNIDAALGTAIPFPKGHPLHVNEENLTLPEENLLKLLDSRLIPMMLLFKQDIEALGFVY